MSKYVFNKVTITGPEVSIKSLLDSVQSRSSLFDFETIFPTPKLSRNQLQDWRSTNWGTVRNSIDAVISQSNPTHVTITFQTVWKSPTAVVKVLSSQHPDLGVLLTSEYQSEKCVRLTTYSRGEILAMNSMSYAD